MYIFVLAACLLIGASGAQRTSEQNVCTGRRPGFFVSDVRRCDGYFLCHPDGRAIFDVCPLPFMFNQTQQACDHASKVQCFQCPPNEFRSQRPVQGTCNQYVQCINNVPEHRFCPSNLNFNDTTNRCELNVACNPEAPIRSCPPVTDPNNPIYFRDEKNCAKYEFCENGRLVAYTCPPGLHFNLRIRQCDIPANAGCKGGGEAGEFTCPPSTGGLPIYAHPTDCMRFFICADGVATPQTCPAGTAFDISVQDCVTSGTCANGSRF